MSSHIARSRIRSCARTSARTAFTISVLLLATACASDRTSLTGPSATKSLSISFATAPVITAGAGQRDVPSATGAVLAPMGLRTSGALQAVSGTDTLVITRAQLVLSRVELTRSAGAACDDDSSRAECSELEQHFVLVDLPTDATVHTSFAASIPAGTYASLEARLRIPRSSEDGNASAFLAAHPEFASANVRVEGSFKGQPFTYLGAADTRFELAFAPPIVVDSSGANVTVHVDITTWFRAASGALLDPSSANAGGVNAAQVAGNIARSFHAVRDDGRDGHDDADGHSGHHG